MDFSVVVKGGGNPPLEENRDELERFLRSARISPSVLGQLRPGKAHILKKQLSYEQAIEICDRLTGLGLQSAVRPPGRPIKRAPSAVASGRTSRSPQLLQSSVRTAPEPPTHSSATPPAQRAPVASLSSKGSQHTATAQMAEEIKKMFAPAAGNLKVQLPTMYRLRAWILVLRGLALGASMLIAATALALCIAGVIGMAYVLLSNISTLLAGLLILCPALLALAAIASGLLPFWRAVPTPAIQLARKDQPRFFLLTTAICKIIGAPAPNSIFLTAEPRVRSEYRCGTGSLLNPRQALRGQWMLHLGLPLLVRLDVHELAALIARECGRFATPSLERPYSLLLQQQHWSAQHLKCAPLRKQIPEWAARFVESRPPALVSQLIAAGDRLQNGTCRAIEIYHRHLTGLLADKDALADHYEAAILGEKSPSLCSKISESASALAAALEDALWSNSLYIPDALSEVVAESVDAVGRTQRTQQNTQAGLIRCRQPALSLLNDFQKLDRAVTRSLYHSIGVRLDAVQLVSRTELQQRRSNSALLDEAASDYFGAWFHQRHFWLLPPEDFANRAERKILLSRLNHCISRIRYLTPDRHESLMNHYKLRLQLLELESAKLIISYGHRYPLRHCPGVPVREIEKQSAIRRLRLGEISEELRQQNAVMGERLALALTLDRRHRNLTNKLNRALRCMSEMEEKAHRLEDELEKLIAVNRYKPRKRSQQYHLHRNEIRENTENLFRALRRKMEHCPYDFYDRRFANVDVLLSARLRNVNEGLKIEGKSRVLLDTLAEAYGYTSKLAAYFALQLEKSHGAEPIRRI